MDIKIVGKDLKATDAIKDYTAKKLERIEKYFEGDIDCLVTIKVEKNVQIAEIQVSVPSRALEMVLESAS